MDQVGEALIEGSNKEAKLNGQIKRVGRSNACESEMILHGNMKSPFLETKPIVS